MLNSKFDAWCDAATAKIRYWGDRDAVSAELRAHLEDRYDALIEAGFSHTEATAKALAAMGSAKTIAPQLGKIHSPWLGWILGIVRLIGITAVGCAVIIWFYSFPWDLGSVPQPARPVNLRSLINYSWEMTDYEEPGGQAQWENYHMQVKEALLITEVAYIGKPELNVLIEVTCMPWETGFGAKEAVWAQDSQGNVYRPLRYLGEQPDVPCVACRITSSGETGRFYLWCQFGNFDPDAQWIELRYDRDGRNMVMRIDLTGGGGR